MASGQGEQGAALSRHSRCRPVLAGSATAPAQPQPSMSVRLGAPLGKCPAKAIGVTERGWTRGHQRCLPTHTLLWACESLSPGGCPQTGIGVSTVTARPL